MVEVGIKVNYCKLVTAVHVCLWKNQIVIYWQKFESLLASNVAIIIIIIKNKPWVVWLSLTIKQHLMICTCLAMNGHIQIVSCCSVTNDNHSCLAEFGGGFGSHNMTEMLYIIWKWITYLQSVVYCLISTVAMHKNLAYQFVKNYVI